MLRGAFDDIRVSERDLARAQGLGSFAAPRDEAPHGTRVSVTAVNEAVAELMRGDNPERVVDQSLAATIGGTIRPSIEKMVTSKVGSGAELLGLSGFRMAVSQYLTSPASSGLDAETRKVMLHKLENANRTSAEFSALIAQGGIRLAALGGALSSETAREVARAEGRSIDARGRSSMELAHGLNGGPYTAATLSDGMRSHIDNARGIHAGHVANVGNYLHGLGINAPQYTGYFAGSSEAIRNAIRDHIKDGRKITDDEIKNPKDAKAIIGAIKAGKMKKEDAPPSVQKLMEDMEKKGIDPAKTDPKAIDQYFQQNPKALEEMKRANDKAIKDQQGLTNDQKLSQIASSGPSSGGAKSPNAAAKAPDAKAGATPTAPATPVTVKLST